MSENTRTAIGLVDTYAAYDYSPLPVVVTEASDTWLAGVDGRRYLDCPAAYSALNFGHGNPALIDATKRQLDRLTLTNRATHSDWFGPFAQELARLVNKDVILPMNASAEVVGTAIKVTRRWGHQVKGLSQDHGEIIAMHGSLHGRTTTIISFSDDETARADFGPYNPKFRLANFGDVESLRQAITPETVAVLPEPIQGEASIIVPPAGYLREVRKLTHRNNILLTCDEVQTGMGRTGATFRFQTKDIDPDIITVGRTLDTGIVLLPAVIADREILGLLRPGEHDSTFGGNPLACAVGSAVCGVLAAGEYQRRSAGLGKHLHAGLEALVGHGVTAARGAGLWAGIDIGPAIGTAKDVSLDLLDHSILMKDTHGQTLRLAPPLMITEDEIDLIVRKFRAVLGQRLTQHA